MLKPVEPGFLIVFDNIYCFSIEKVLTPSRLRVFSVLLGFKWVFDGLDSVLW